MSAIELVITVTAGLLVIAGILLYRHLSAHSRERAIRRAFQHRMSKHLLERILQDPELGDFSAKRKQLTVLFSEIQGHDAMDQGLPPDEVMAVLRDYLGVMIGILLKHGGTVDKVMGNRIMALFGDPAPHQDHALRAVRTALEMQREMGSLHKRWIVEEKSGLRVRIGIATGDACVGDAGSPGQVEYVVIGPVVDLAAQLQSMATPGGVLISQETCEEVKGAYECVGVPGLVLKDHQKPYQAYRVEPSRPASQTGEPADQASERRERRRVELATGVKFAFDGKTYLGRVVDASQDGMFIATDELPAVGTFITVEGEVHDKGEVLPVWILGMVKRHVAAGEGRGIGIQFDHIRANDKETIRYFLRNVFGIYSLEDQTISADTREDKQTMFRYDFDKPDPGPVESSQSDKAKDRK